MTKPLHCESYSASHLFDLTNATIAGAAAGYFIGPLGTTGNGLACLFNMSFLKIIVYLNNPPMELKENIFIIALIATEVFSSLYAAAYFVDVSITFSAALITGMVDFLLVFPSLGFTRFLRGQT